MIKSILLAGLLCLAVSILPAQVIKSAMINGCKTEGLNEYLIVKNGNASFTATSSNIDIRYGTSSPASTTITDQLLTNGDSVYVASLNAKLGGGCDFNFINATDTTTIAANAYFMTMHKYPDDTADFSAWCGKSIGNVYVVFADDASWGNSGIFANDTRSTTRFLRSTINSVTYDYNYGGINLNSDGGYVTWNDSAGTFSGNGNYSNCTPTNLQSLPVSLLYFNAEWKNDAILLTWATASEINNDHFAIEAFESNLSNWEIIGELSGFIHKQSTSFYEFLIPQSFNHSKYYKLSQTDIDGKKTELAIASIQEAKNQLSVIGHNKQFLFISFNNLALPILISCFRLDGSLLSKQEFNPFNSIIKYSIPACSDGIMLLKIQQGEQLIIHKYFNSFK